MVPVDKGPGLSAVVLCDQAITRAALAALLRAEPAVGQIRQAPHTAAADEACARGDVDVVLVSHIASGSTVGAVRQLREAGCEVPIVVLGLDGSAAFVRASLAAGAGGVLTADAAPGELADALRAVAGGSSYVHPTLGAMLAQMDAIREVDVLSPRELEVLRYIALGFTNPQIAAALVVSVRTVETHRAHLARKLGAETRADLVRHAIDQGLLSSD